jgi:enoyl-CoA hydratase
MSQDVQFARTGALATITLDRPKALNALNLEMIRAIGPQLAAWANDADVAAVAIAGAGDKAFCAGGDVRALALARREDPNTTLTRDFFWHEYRLNRQIHRYAKPYVAMIDGIAMGGGVGLSVPGRYRVITEKTVFAMPEMGIGLFPDVGGSYYLSRAPGELGVYVALTGARLNAADVMYCGFGTHYVPSAKLPALLKALAKEPAETALARFHTEPGTAPISRHRGAIDRCFAAPTVEAILDSLLHEGGDWGRHARDEILTKKSPTSLKVTLQQLRRGRMLSFEDCMRMEFRLVQAFMRGHDFFEGVRALLIDKDQTPRWNPPSLAAVTDVAVQACFAPSGQELTFD